MGPQDQPDFINAVAKIKTALTPEALLSALQEIENQSGRLRTRHWGPRTLDLDIILYGRWVVDTAQLKIPHPGLYDRNFVLYPLQEIEPGIDIPGYGPIVSLLAACPKADLCVVSDV
jgi:2-amino-4-hydroxy-6-hydroxymethyldihydropteridine diphosphokinase